jgi:hypothetical protein
MEVEVKKAAADAVAAKQSLMKRRNVLLGDVDAKIAEYDREMVRGWVAPVGVQRSYFSFLSFFWGEGVYDSTQALSRSVCLRPLVLACVCFAFPPGGPHPRTHTPRC